MSAHHDNDDEELARLVGHREEPGNPSPQHVTPTRPTDASTVSNTEQDEPDPSVALLDDHSKTALTSSDSSTKEELFFDGELRPTLVHTSHPRKDGKAVFTLPQVLGKKSDISFAILSSFVSDINWIRGHFDPSTRSYSSPMVKITRHEPPRYAFAQVG
ncbi:hypothetical protein BDZ89DRAFT_1054046 [Hymenopellis radicata]|nr:hypothetical protein BDZ89DRAFT_1054046 [Hymenopellis radicata]